MRKYFKNNFVAQKIPEQFEGQKEEQAKTREFFKPMMDAVEKEKAETLKTTAKKRTRKVPTGRTARALALLEFLKVLEEETGVSLSGEDVKTCGRKKPIFCCAYCNKPLKGIHAAEHVRRCKKNYQFLRQHNLLGIYRVTTRLPNGRFETVYPDLIEMHGGKAYCVVCGQPVEGPEHFSNGGSIGCTVLEDFLKQRDLARLQWRTAIRKGRLVYMREGI